MTPAPSPPAYEFLPGARREVLVLCDHASHAIPAEYGDLGLDAPYRRAHIAWDVGAALVARRLARALDCPAFFGAWSRLVADLNRAPEAGDLIVCESDCYFIRGNLVVRTADRIHRLERYHRPYHAAIEAHLYALQYDRIAPALISIHSFTPVFGGRARPWQIGFLWQQREPWLDGLIANLRGEGYTVGDNKPYDGRAMLGYTIEQHALKHGYRHVLIELRQDLLDSEAHCAQWAARLLRHLTTSGFFARTA